MDDDNVLDFPQAPQAVELRHLRAFVAVAEELNFGRAAERLYITQPALSRQIRGLEHLLGCELLRRSTHGVRLTLAGEALLDRTRPLLRDVDAAVSAAQSVSGELVARVTRLWEPVILATATETELDVQEVRRAYEDLHAQFDLPPEVDVRPANAGGVSSLAIGGDLRQPAALLYLHGGGYVIGSAFGYRPLVGALAVATGLQAVCPDYRLAPEHPFPAAVEDAVTAYRWMLESGVDPQAIRVAGDSSGGGLALSLMLRLAEHGLPQPGGAILLCPWLDLGDDSGGEFANRAAALYLAGHPPDDPLVKPLEADLSGLPPLLIQAATGDDRLGDAKALAEHARSCGVGAELELYDVDAHVFQLFWSFLPEAAEALQSAGRFSRGLEAEERAERA